ncbi:MAG: phosphate ABC transporter permease subunit PstC [Christensenellales bacterium]|jgi:phosphate transport system permease protein
MKAKSMRENSMKYVFLISALFSIVAIAIICFYIFYRGVPAIFEIGLGNFLMGTKWSPSSGTFGIFSMIVGSLYATLGAVAIGVPTGIFAAVFLAEFCPQWLYRLIKPVVQLLAGIPSVIYGFFGLVVIVPFIRTHIGGAGNSLLAAIIILAIMILPTIISISEAALRAVPRLYYEGGLALGENHTGSVFRLVLPAAKSGVVTSVILGIGRAVGETMAVILVAGNTTLVPTALTDSIRTMTAGIAMEMSYASGLHQQALFGIGVVLFVFIILLNVALNFVKRKAGDGS